MRFWELVSSAFSSVNGNKIRAILTMFGIVVGISAVITLSSFGNGFKNSIESEFESFGLDQVIITNNSNSLLNAMDILNMDDVNFLKKYNKLVAVSPSYSVTFRSAIKTNLNSNFRDVTLVGVDEDYYRLGDNEVLYGRCLNESDIRQGSAVAIIGDDLAKNIFGNIDVIGKNLVIDTNIGKENFIIIGIYENKFDDLLMPVDIIVPITYVQNISSEINKVSDIKIKVCDKDKIDIISENIINLLELKNNVKDIYDKWLVAVGILQISNVLGIFTKFLIFVASISLLVSGIGVMNIMLVNVTERTKEIGIRKSLGATNFSIKIQFLIESIMICVIAGIIGIVFGYFSGLGVSTIASKILHIKIVPNISLLNIFIVVLVCSLIGILFGVYPAGKAAKLDPIEALKFD